MSRDRNECLALVTYELWHAKQNNIFRVQVHKVITLALEHIHYPAITAEIDGIVEAIRTAVNKNYWSRSEFQDDLKNCTEQATLF